MEYIYFSKGDYHMGRGGGSHGGGGHSGGRSFGGRSGGGFGGGGRRSGPGFGGPGFGGMPRQTAEKTFRLRTDLSRSPPLGRSPQRRRMFCHHTRFHHPALHLWFSGTKQQHPAGSGDHCIPDRADSRNRNSQFERLVS